MSPAPFSLAGLSSRLERLDLEIARLSIAAGIRLLDLGVAERVLRGDCSVGRRADEVGLRKLAALIVLHRRLLAQADGIAGLAAADELARAVRNRLRGRVRGQLGGRWRHRA